MSAAIPFVIPSEFLAAVQSGAVEQIGALLKNTATGKIVGHLQETGAMQQIASSVLDLNPVSSFAQIGLDATNTMLAVRADRKLSALTEMVGSVQTMQMITLASSVAGIGVTVASTLVILNRLKGITEGLNAVTEKIDALPKEWRELDLKKTLGDVQTQLERLEEIESRKNAKPVVENVEENLHTAFNRLHHGAVTVMAEMTIDGQLLQQLLAGLALSGGAQIRSLYELDEVETAGKRAQTQFEKLQTLSIQMPQDVLVRKLQDDADEAAQLSGLLSQIRMATASQPSLAKQLSSMGVAGSDYLARSRDEKEEPLLLLPSN